MQDSLWPGINGDLIGTSSRLADFRRTFLLEYFDTGIDAYYIPVRQLDRCFSL
jgi:hypothetical protein